MSFILDLYNEKMFNLLKERDNITNCHDALCWTLSYLSSLSKKGMLEHFLTEGSSIDLISIETPYSRQTRIPDEIKMLKIENTYFLDRWKEHPSYELAIIDTRCDRLNFYAFCQQMPQGINVVTWCHESSLNNLYSKIGLKTFLYILQTDNVVITPFNLGFGSERFLDEQLYYLQELGYKIQVKENGVLSDKEFNHYLYRPYNEYKSDTFDMIVFKI